MTHCRPNLQTAKVLFSILTGKIISLGFDIDVKTTNQCFDGLRMEDQGIEYLFY